MEDVFSPTEKEILKLLGRRKMTISEITEKIYGHGRVIPLGANNNIAGAVRRINRKCEYHKLSWFLNGQGGGRAGRMIWRDKSQKGLATAMG